jgi:hypothetical protein
MILDIESLTNNRSFRKEKFFRCQEHCYVNSLSQVIDLCLHWNDETKNMPE